MPPKMSKNHKKTRNIKGWCKKIIHFFKVNLIAGLVVLAPLVVTLWLFRTLVLTVDNWLLRFIPQRYHLNELLEQIFGIDINISIHGLGLIAGILFLVLVGLLVRNIFGRKLLKWGESILGAIPGVSSVYNAVKQISETLAFSNSKSFRKVVMLEYPRKGIWSIGFVSGSTKGQAQRAVDKTLINVFLPTTPNPTSGFLLLLPEEDLIELDMTVHEGLKLVMSAGIVSPPDKNNVSESHDLNQNPNRQKNGL